MTSSVSDKCKPSCCRGMDCTEVMYNIQRGFSQAQRIPVIGVVPSCFKLLFSTAQVIGGFATYIISSSASLCCPGQSDNQCLNKAVVCGEKNVCMGSISVGYACGNILTCGCLGCTIESLCEGCAETR